jgi:phosphatidylglycerophosphatase A
MRTINVIDKFILNKCSVRSRSIIFFIVSFFATGCFVGKIKYAPGTFGSLLAIIFCPYFILLSKTYQIIILISLIVLGFFCTHVFLQISNKQNQDPKEVVIDEIVAVFFASWLCQFSNVTQMNWQHFLSIFALFRFFDILKPYPISWIDKNVLGAKGIILDDLAAAIASWIVFASYY